MATIKIIEIMGSSAGGWEDAVRTAVRSATRTLDEVTGVDVISWTAKVGPEGTITAYHADCKVAFKVKDD